ncbi:MAG: hypothetical protein Q8O99_05040 [bacterium]|nr:hypothetical protein [bacterium]
MIGEYLPFRRDLELGSEVDLSASTCTDIDSSKKIPGGSLKCTFELYNGYSQQPVARLEDLPCMDDKRSDSDVSLFNELKPTASPTRMGSSWLQLTDIVTKGIAGEYQLMLSKVEYISCE